MVEAMAKLVETIRDPRPRARGKTVWPGRATRRAERAADDAGEKMPETAARSARPGQTVFPLARGRGSRIASTNFAIASTISY